MRIQANWRGRKLRAKFLEYRYNKHAAVIQKYWRRYAAQKVWFSGAAVRWCLRVPSLEHRTWHKYMANHMGVGGNSVWGIVV